MIQVQNVGAPRIALYSPDSYGLGHFRRNRRIAAALVRAFPQASVLMLTGCLAADRFSALPNTDLVRLPATTKSIDGSYVSRSLGLDSGSLLHLRASILEAAVGSFGPDILIVDHAPGGLAGELVPVLERLRERSRPALVALGLRDVLDDRRVVRAQWLRDGTYRLLDWAYDEVWVYGRREVYDPVVEYGIEREVAHRVQFLGYISDPPSAPARRRRGRVPHVVGMGGGGEDAFPVMRTLVGARSLSETRFRMTIFPGPLMGFHERRDLEAAAATVGRDVVVHNFTERVPTIVAHADAVVTMGGYNSTMEVLAAGVPSIVVPRVTPRVEQLIRARRMADRGWIRLIHPEDLSPERLRDEVLATLAGGPPAALPPDFLNGLDNVVERCRQSLSAPHVEPAPAAEAGAAGWPAG
ncbi:MAG: glycosyltransferase family protein [Candidatus Dormibacteraceae bacterium]